MKVRTKSTNPLRKMAGRGFRGYPVATVALYGPDNLLATKVAVGIVLSEDEEPIALERWLSQSADIRNDLAVTESILEFIRSHNARSVVITDRIIGCPHEEGKDYPVGENCPHCPFWHTIDRFTHEPLS